MVSVVSILIAVARGDNGVESCRCRVPLENPESA